MSMDLDTRQRAMLLEMGVRVWEPVAPAEPAPATVAAVSASLQTQINVPALPLAAAPDPATSNTSPAGPDPTTIRQPARLPSPTRLTGLASGIESMDWPALAAAVLDCQACAMCLGRRAPVLAAPAQAMACDWLVVGDPPDEAQERSGQPFVEEAGQLLDNMLRAVGVRRWNHAANPGIDPTSPSRAYLTHVLKCRPALMRVPDAVELSTCAHFLRREIALTQPKVIVAMGRFAMQLLLGETPPEQARLPLGKLRGQVWRFAGVPVVVTYPPDYLLRNGLDKARAWADLCLARTAATGAMGTP